jgi:hypothetical protein
VRRVDHDHPRVRPHQPGELVEVVTKAVLRAQLPARDIAADRLSHGVELLIRRVDGHDVIARAEQGCEQEVVGLDRPGGDQDLVRGRVGVDGGEGGAQGPGAPSLGVAEPEIEHLVERGRPLVLGHEREHVAGGQRVDAALRDVELDLRLPAGHPPFQRERGHLHADLPRLRGETNRERDA